MALIHDLLRYLRMNRSDSCLFNLSLDIFVLVLQVLKISCYLTEFFFDKFHLLNFKVVLMTLFHHFTDFIFNLQNLWVILVLYFLWSNVKIGSNLFYFFFKLGDILTNLSDFCRTPLATLIGRSMVMLCFCFSNLILELSHELVNLLNLSFNFILLWSPLIIYLFLPPHNLFLLLLLIFYITWELSQFEFKLNLSDWKLKCFEFFFVILIDRELVWF